jgi:hypothetical protein
VIMAGIRQGEAGGIVTEWLLRIVLFLAALAFVIFEGGAIAVNSITAEDATREVARAAVTAYRGSGEIDAAESAGVAAARDRGVRLTEITIDGDSLSVTVRSTARTLVLHKVEMFDRFTIREVERMVEW